jgi:hypothetical protein
MLYKYYRYILIGKIALLIAGGFILYSQRSSPWYNGGTTIIVFSGSQNIDPYNVIWLTNITPWPYALLRAENENITLHVPWTYDTWYIFQYLRNWFPLVDKELTDYSYFRKCMVTINVIWKETKITQCQKYWLDADIWAIVFVILWVIL